MIMRDSVTAGRIPPGTPVVAGYADGNYAWTSADWAEHADAVCLSIAVHPGTQADILDVENGDATPQDVPGWIDRFQRPGRRRPTVYCSRSAIAAVRAATGAREFDWWAATLDGTTAVPGAVAVQYVDYGGYDESTILDPSWVGMDHLPTVVHHPPNSSGEPVVNLETARVVIWIERLILFGPLALSEPNAQAAVDAYAQRIVNGENPEAVLQSLFNDAQRDGRLDIRFKVG